MINDRTLRPDEVQVLKALIVDTSVEHCTEVLGISIVPLLKLAAGLPVRPGTVALYRNNHRARLEGQRAAERVRLVRSQPASRRP